MRRDLSALERARAYLRMRAEMGDNPRSEATGDVRDMLAKHFGVSGRTLDRYAAILRCSRVIQDAFSRGELTLVQAASVAGLRPKEQEALAKQIDEGVPPKEAYRAIAAPSKRAPKKAAATESKSEKPSTNSLLAELKRTADGLSQASSINQAQLRLFGKLIDELVRVQATLARGSDAA
jgi:hypothetical protein